MTKIAVTGGSGKAGRAVVSDLKAHGHDVLNIDLGPSPESYHYPDDAPIPFLRADLTDYGQTIEALAGAEALPGIEAVVHLAAIPAPQMAPPAHIFQVNAVSTYNVFSAAWRLGLHRVVWASSETTLGLPFDTPPDYAPVDEKHMRPESSYALSKDVGEEMARQFSRAQRDADHRPALLQRDGPRGLSNGSRAGRTIPTRASGTCGATSTSRTSPRASAVRSAPTSPAMTRS